MTLLWQTSSLTTLKPQNNHIIQTIKHFDNQFVAALEDVAGLKLAAKDYNATYNKIDGWERLGRHLAEQNYLCITERMINFNHLNTQQKYAKFIADFGTEVTARIPNYHITSYLGITTPLCFHRLPKPLSAWRKNLVVLSA